MAIPKSPQIQYFEEIYACWKEAIQHVKVQSVAVRGKDGWIILEARIDLIPQSIGTAQDEVVRTGSVRFGRERFSVTTTQLDALLDNARKGQIELADDVLLFPSGAGLSEYTPTPFSEPKYILPQLEIRPDQNVLFSQSLNYEQVNSDLRSGPVPFAGLADALSCFGFGNAEHLPHETIVRISLHPPCDLQGHCELSDNKLKVTLLRRSTFDPELVKIGIRMFPNPTFSRRRQIGKAILWHEHEDGFEEGVAEVTLDDCSAAELFVTAGGHSVCRAYIEDQDKRLNHRLADYQVFDRDLAYLRKALTSAKEARNLEVGVATLCYLLGATAVTPPNSDTPDVFVETPGKRFALVECTTALADVHAKVGKLAGRRTALLEQHDKIGVHRELMAILVVNNRPNLTHDVHKYIADNQVILVTLAEIEFALERVQVPVNLDALYDRKMEELRTHLAINNFLMNANSPI
jgi:hypothetical protein